MRLKFIAFFTILTLFSLSCTKDIREVFGEIFELSAKLGKKFNEGPPNVSIGEKGIAVTFTNTSFNDLSPNEKEIKAREIALFVRDSYSKIGQIEEIMVVFGISKSYFGFEYINNLDAHTFKVKELNSVVEPSR